MSERYKFDTFKKKLQGICEENGLVFRFRYEDYPIALTIRPVSGVSEQMSMLEQAEEHGYKSPDSVIVFEYQDGELFYRTDKRFTIDDALFNKIKNLYKNMHYLWLQNFFRTVVQKVKTGAFAGVESLPVIEDDDPTKMHGGAGRDLPGENLDSGIEPDPLDIPDSEDLGDDVLESLDDELSGEDFDEGGLTNADEA